MNSRYRLRRRLTGRKLLRYVWSGLTLIVTLVGLAVWAVSERDLPPGALEERYATAPSQFIVLPSGLRVHVRDEGDPNAPVLMLIHGSNDSLFTFNDWAGALSSRYRTIRFDLPGHGLTGPAVDDDYTYPAQLRVIDELAAHLHLSRFAIAGNSYGGGIAWRYALTRPERVRALILIDASGAPRPRLGVYRLLAIGGIGDLIFNATPRILVDTMLRQALLDPTRINDALVDRFHDLIRREGNRRATLLRARVPLEADAPWERLNQIIAPTLILWGEKDSVIPKSVGDALAAAIPHARLIVYPGIGHVPQLERPAESAADVRAFLDTLP